MSKIAERLRTFDRLITSGPWAWTERPGNLLDTIVVTPEPSDVLANFFENAEEAEVITALRNALPELATVLDILAMDPFEGCDSSCDVCQALAALAEKLEVSE